MRWIGLLLIPFAAAASALEGPQDGRAGPAESTELEAVPALEEARQRWESMDADDQAELARRFAELREMAPGERAAAYERLSELLESRTEVEAELPAEERKRLERAAPRERRGALRELHVSRSRENGQRVRSKLPKALVAQLRQAQPEERRRLLSEFREKRSKRGYRRLVKDYCEALETDAAERSRLLLLPPEERRPALLRLERAFVRARVDRIGPPGGMDLREWEEWDALEDSRFFRRWRRLEPSAAYRPDFVAQPGALPENAAGAARPGPAARSNVAAREAGDAYAYAWRRIREACHPTVTELLAVSHLPRRERAQLVAFRVRGRVEDAIREADLLDEATLASVVRLDDRAFLSTLYQITRDRSEKPIRGRKGDRKQGR